MPPTDTAGAVPLWMGVLLPPALAAQFPPPQSADDVPHVTVVYALLDPADVEQATQIALDVVAQVAPIPVSIGGLGHFDNEDASVAWAGVDAPGLADLRTRVLAALTAAGVGAEQTHAEYVPHATIAYLPPGGRWAGVVPAGSFVARSVEMSAGLGWVGSAALCGGAWPTDMAKAAALAPVTNAIAIHRHARVDMFPAGGSARMDDLQKAIDAAVAKAGELSDDDVAKHAAALEKGATDLRAAKKGGTAGQTASTEKAAARWPMDMAQR